VDKSSPVAESAETVAFRGETVACLSL